MKKRLISVALSTLISTSAMAQVYECIDSRGNHSYVEIPKGKNCHPASNLGVNFSTTSAYKPAPSYSTTIAKETDSTASNQPNPAAVATARKNLADAQKALEEGKKVRLGSERNYARYQERIKGLEDVVKARQQELDSAMGNNNTNTKK
ncbi:lipoic acid synthetase [Snodgrassella alvi]|uniref:lipoic acid synthetase n=1 Tax=Snodgrassella alvi TaxID=1196083 RepID=UPI000C1F0018|nr:lipoic acid synthetase [Snodgrassella alvi]PIT14220.1 hypothetical protein BGI33_08045 [Snodgrassella alvi]PIT16737.1 hypothetical protein BGI34_09400 [Snodgrassella alvi]